MKKPKHFNAAITVHCFMVGAALPPQSLREFIYVLAMFSFVVGMKL